MNINKILYDVIEKEIACIEQDGIKVKFKAVKKRRIIFTIICGFFFICFLAAGPAGLLLALLDLILYFVLLYNNTRINVIAKLAKKNPDKQISEIILEDMKK